MVFLIIHVVPSIGMSDTSRNWPSGCPEKYPWIGGDEPYERQVNKLLLIYFVMKARTDFGGDECNSFMIDVVGEEFFGLSFFVPS